MKRLLVVVILALVVPCLAFGQATQPKAAPSVAQAAPKPGPENKKLEIWIGNWTYEGEIKATPLGPAGKLTGKATARPVLGGFFVEIRGEEKGPSGTLQWFEIDGYDPATKRFMWYGFNSEGRVSTITYTFEGNTVTYSGPVLAGGKQVQIRGTGVVTADLMSQVWKEEMSLDGKTWMPSVEARWTKTKPSPK